VVSVGVWDRARVLEAILAAPESRRDPLPHRLITMRGGLPYTYTYNTNRRQSPSKDRKDTKPEHQEGKKQIKEGRYKQRPDQAVTLYYVYFQSYPFSSSA
jgi:hypothetical protein